MRKSIFVFLITLFCLVLQLVFAKLTGGMFVPNFSLIGVIFLNLYRGLNYSLGGAFLSGFFLDSYSAGLPGLNVFSLVSCAFLTATLKKYIYQPGVSQSRVFMVILVVSANSFLQYFVHGASGADIGFGQALMRAILPEVIMTAFVATMVFERLKQCALKLLA